jgi:serine/threonine protein kinase
LNLLKRLENKYIVKYIGYVQDESNINLIMEFVEGGSLAKLIQKFGKIPEPLCARYISQVLLGLDYIHRRGVIHRDIKW